MSRHAFVMNCHNDVHQLSQMLEYLAGVFVGTERYVYMDGKEYTNGSLEYINTRSTIIRADHEPIKAISIINAVNRIANLTCDTASFLHADMIPTDKDQYYRFLERFLESPCAVATTSIWPYHRAVSFCDLHFKPARCKEMGLLPIDLDVMSQLIEDEQVNEFILAESWYKHCPTWKEHVYKLWSMVYPYSGMPGIRRDAKGKLKNSKQWTSVSKHGHTLDRAFEVHNFTPETSVIHTNDPEFWLNAEEICRWS